MGTRSANKASVKRTLLSLAAGGTLPQGGWEGGSAPGCSPGLGAGWGSREAAAGGDVHSPAQRPGGKGAEDRRDAISSYLLVTSSQDLRRAWSSSGQGINPAQPGGNLVQHPHLWLGGVKLGCLPLDAVGGPKFSHAVQSHLCHLLPSAQTGLHHGNIVGLPSPQAAGCCIPGRRSCLPAPGATPMPISAPSLCCLSSSIHHPTQPCSMPPLNAPSPPQDSQSEWGEGVFSAQRYVVHVWLMML